VGRIIHGPGGRELHIGGRLAPPVGHHLKLHAPEYSLDLSKWPTPSSTSYGKASAAQACLLDVLGNNKRGCCTESDAFHGQALRQAAGGRPVFHPSEDQVFGVYSRDGGFDKANPDATDNGCDETVVLGNEQSQGIQSADDGTITCIQGYVLVDACNRDLVRAAVSTFVGASICMAIPDALLNPFPSSAGWRWSVPAGGWIPNPANGHCFTLGDQEDGILRCWSWGMPFDLTYDALAAGAVASSGGALYIRLDAQILDAASQRAPDGLDWDALRADLTEIPSAIITPPGP
jgi:hypothetical protein